MHGIVALAFLMGKVWYAVRQFERRARSGGGGGNVTQTTYAKYRAHTITESKCVKLTCAQLNWMLTSLLVRFESGGIQHVVEYYCTQTNDDDGNDVDGIVKCSLWRIVRYLQHTYTLIRCRLPSNEQLRCCTNGSSQSQSLHMCFLCFTPFRCTTGKTAKHSDDQPFKEAKNRNVRVECIQHTRT